MKTEIIKKYYPENSRNQFWTLRFPNNGKVIEQIIGSVDRYSYEEAKGIAYASLKQMDIDRLCKEIEREIIVSSCPTLKDFSEIYINHVKGYKKSWDRDERSFKHLNRLLGDHKLTDINKSMVYDYQSERLEEESERDGELIKPATVNRETDCLRGAFNIAIEMDIFPFPNPLSNYDRLIENNFRKRILSEDEEYRLMIVSELFLQNIITCALNTGMRKGEILTLEWNDVDINSGFIFLKGKNTKNGKPRDININQSMRKIFEDIKKSNSSESIIFLNSEQKPYASPDAIKNVFNNALKNANIENFTFHDLRRTFATRMYENGVEIAVISAILGHSSIEMTKRYLSIDNLKRRALESLDD